MVTPQSRRILRRPSQWRYFHGRSADFTVTPPLSARGPTQISDRQSLQIPSPWCMKVGDLGVRPPRLHISVLTTICARHKLDKLAVLPVIEAFAFTHPCACSTIPSRSSPVYVPPYLDVLPPEAAAGKCNRGGPTQIADRQSLQMPSPW